MQHGHPIDCMTLQGIYQDHFRFVWRTLRRLGVPEADVADAVQDVFVVVHRKLAEFRGDSRVSTWLFGICMRVASDRRRLAHLRHEISGGPSEQHPDPSADVVAEVERRNAHQVLQRILDEMPMEQRAVFVLFELDGLQCESIAELIDIPLGTVYSRLRIAREFFQKNLKRRQVRDQFRLGKIGAETA
jgi:RNA polymerase sigma-70 factor, ECF subfamily